MKNTKRVLARGVIGTLIVTSLLLLPADPALGKMHFSTAPTHQVPLGPYRVNADPYPVDLYLYYPPVQVHPRREPGPPVATAPPGTGPVAPDKANMPPLATGR